MSEIAENLNEPVETKKVTMKLTEKDIKNTNEIRRIIHARSKAAAVSASLSVANLVVNELSQGNSILIKDKNGNLKEIMMPELAD